MRSGCSIPAATRPSLRRLPVNHFNVAAAPSCFAFAESCAKASHCDAHRGVSASSTQFGARCPRRSRSPSQSEPLPGALNRLYYAALYAARALLALREIDSSRHSGVIALFYQHFVRTAIVDAEVARVFSRAFEKRLTTDYGD